jgi:uncharacterized protein YndB with AHSA1/START domain
MIRRTLTDTFVVPAALARVWDHLVDPVACAASWSHPVTVELGPGPVGTVGSTWTEMHGEECDFDVVPHQVVAVEPGRSLTVDLWQSGVRQRSTTTLQAVDDEHTSMTSTLRLSVSLKAHGSPVERIVMFGILATGLGMSLVRSQFEEGNADSLAYWESLER